MHHTGHIYHIVLRVRKTVLFAVAWRDISLGIVHYLRLCKWECIRPVCAMVGGTHDGLSLLVDFGSNMFHLSFSD